MMGIFVGSDTSYRGVLEKSFNRALADIQFGISHKILNPEIERQTYITLQQSIPAGEAWLSRLEFPFLSDFRRNLILIADWPGNASLPPGMPLNQGSDALADYLLSQSIRYVAYTSGTEAGFRRQDFISRLDSSERQWIKVTTQNTFTFQDHLLELSKTRKKLYDDGKHFVLDINQRIK
jgi:hypothetical protein